MSKLVFLKLGGSLITDKFTPNTVLPERLAQISGEIQTALAADPELQLIIGHGSGSFGHVPAKEHNTKTGVRSAAQWQGFAEVAQAAETLNRHTIDALRAANVPAIHMLPSASATAQNGAIVDMALKPIIVSLSNGLVPVVHGDVCIDNLLGGTIVSTETVFTYLAEQLSPTEILLAGNDDGVLTHFPDGDLVKLITRDSLDQFEVAGSKATDVTGGMKSKVEGMLDLIDDVPDLEIRIFNGNIAGNITKALTGTLADGTVIR